MADKKSNHLLLHIGLISFTLLAIYPVLWVLALAFSGQQSVGMIDLPKDPSFFERLRGVLPIPEHLSVKNFVEVWTDHCSGCVPGLHCGLCVFPLSLPRAQCGHADVSGIPDVPWHLDADSLVHHHC